MRISRTLANTEMNKRVNFNMVGALPFSQSPSLPPAPILTPATQATRRTFPMTIKYKSILLQSYGGYCVSYASNIFRNERVPSKFVACSRLSVSKVARKAGAGRAGSGEKNRRAREGPSIFLYQTLPVGHRPAAFEKPHWPRAWNRLRNLMNISPIFHSISWVTWRA